MQTSLQRLAACLGVASVVAHAVTGVRHVWQFWRRTALRKQLRSHYPEPRELVTKKVKDRLSARAIDLVAKSTFVIVGSAGRSVEVSPRGGLPGFVKVKNERCIVLPDRKGNNRLDSMENIIGDGRVSLLFLVPGLGETLRVGGTAKITFDPEVLQPLAEGDVVPTSALEIHINTVLLVCAKAVLRAKLWNPSAQLSKDQLPSAGHILSEQTGRPAEEMQFMLDEHYEKHMY